MRFHLCRRLDLSDSSPSYFSKRSCGGTCTDIGSMAFTGTPGEGQLRSQCDARNYAGDYPTNHPLVSPMAAPNYILARLPPVRPYTGLLARLAARLDRI